MKKFNSKEFINALANETNGGIVPNCPYCKGDRFTTTDKFATLLIGDDLGSISIGPSVPAGMLICEKCGHIEFFALGALNLLDRKDEKTDGK